MANRKPNRGAVPRHRSRVVNDDSEENQGDNETSRRRARNPNPRYGFRQRVVPPERYGFETNRSQSLPRARGRAQESPDSPMTEGNISDPGNPRTAYDTMDSSEFENVTETLVQTTERVLEGNQSEERSLPRVLDDIENASAEAINYNDSASTEAYSDPEGTTSPVINPSQNVPTLQGNTPRLISSASQTTSPNHNGEAQQDSAPALYPDLGAAFPHGVDQSDRALEEEREKERSQSEEVSSRTENEVSRLDF